ncbi:putative folylpolyglutamate synthase [Trichinella pseudospiralis]|uniref:tetrahydrofolate synthase n=1 Tax=Trichinella pseudospiralis TaxID=6337 RepID=A0A0V1IJ38_TRIPS|nr:putative folylpolyglutamate synthase [Trichinella pseudospiralis]
MDEKAFHRDDSFQKGVLTFTVPQCTEAMEVFEKRSKEIGSALYAVTDFSNYQYMNNLGIAGVHQKENANLAVHLARYWIMKMGYCCSPMLNMNNARNLKAQLFDAPLSEEEIKALESCRWPGRSQIIKKNGIEYYLDGAHTPLSIQCCAAWFGQAAATTEADYRILVFHCTRGRNAKQLLQPLIRFHFNKAIFCPTNVTCDMNSDSETISYQSDTQKDSEVIRRNMQIWKEIQRQDTELTSMESFCCISTAHDSIRQLFKSENTMITDDNHQRTVQVLVTGSVHLVGGFLSLLNPTLDNC